MKQNRVHRHYNTNNIPYNGGGGWGVAGGSAPFEYPFAPVGLMAGYAARLRDRPHAPLLAECS
jgi:hypothetical protein